MTQDSLPGRETTRRAALAGAGFAGLAATLAACGGGSSNLSGNASGSGQSANGGNAALARTSEIPVGGGKVFSAEKVVVTQPTAGEFKAFSAVCTHMHRARCPPRQSRWWQARSCSPGGCGLS